MEPSLWPRSAPRSLNRWTRSDRHVTLWHPSGFACEEIPLHHLCDPDAVEAHIRRLAEKRWVTKDDLDELRALSERTR